MRPATRQHLIFDADDTLWESNIVFEQVIEEFIAWLDHPALAPDEVRAALDEIERARTRPSTATAPRCLRSASR